MTNYQRFLTPKFIPFDPLELAKETEKIVTRDGPEGLERKYVGIYSAPVYRGIATGYAAGCCLRCVYCWSTWSRDFHRKIWTFELSYLFRYEAELLLEKHGFEIENVFGTFAKKPYDYYSGEQIFVAKKR